MLTKVIYFSLFLTTVSGAAPSVALPIDPRNDATYAYYRDLSNNPDPTALAIFAADLRTRTDPRSAHLRLLSDATVQFKKGSLTSCSALLDSLLDHAIPVEEHYASTAFKLKSMVRTANGRFLDAIALADSGAFHARHEGFEMELVDVLVVKAEAETELEDHARAMLSLNSAMRIAERIHYVKGLGTIDLALGTIHFQQERYDLASRYFEKSLREAITSGAQQLAQNAISNLSSVAIMTDQHEKAVKVIEELLTSSGRDNSGFRSRMLSNLGYIRNAQGRHLEAIRILQSVIDSDQVSSDEIGSIKAYQHMATAQWGLGRSEEALNSLTKALERSRRANSRKTTAELLFKLHKWNVELGYLDAAIVALREYTEVNDSIKEARFSDQLAFSEVLLETEQKERRISEQEQELRYTIQEAEQRATQRNALIASTALLAVIALLLYRTMRTRQHLAAKEKELHHQQVDQLLSQQEIKSINAMLEGQEKERERVAKDLHDRIGSMLGSIKHQIGSLESEVADVKAGQLAQYKKVNSLLDDTAGELRRISHDMAAATLSRFGLEKALKDLRDTLQISGRLSVELSSFGLDQRMERSVELAVYRIIQELVSNVLKHAQARELSISVTRTPGRLSVVVADDGRGFDVSAIHDGMGLTNVRSRAAALGATVQVDSAPGKGTTVSLECPVVE